MAHYRGGVTKTIDAEFLSLPFAIVAEAAISAGKAAGASHVNVSIERAQALAATAEWSQPREWVGDIFQMYFPPLVIKDFNMSTVSPGN